SGIIMIKINTYENYLEHEVEELLSDQLLSKSCSHTNRDSYGPFACADWILPTLVTIHFVQPFVSSLISELGKDAYNHAKAQLSNFSKKAKLKSRLEPTLGSMEIKREFAIDLSFTAQIDDGKTLKLMFPVAFTDKEYSDATSCFLDFLKDYEVGLASLESIGVDLDNRFLRRSIGVVYVPELKSLRWYNPMPEELIEELRKEIERKNT
ncbi:TPA: hypothetical protein I7753_22030, partial [Vibrio vulnificus]|nr:hypothetical protein [Vibrio vulnificus]HAS8484127.1 hypothetical protein [Vibrio vulnificus]